MHNRRTRNGRARERARGRGGGCFRKRPARGFTLLEALAVVVIVAMAMAAAGLTLSTPAQTADRAAAAALETDRRARLIAASGTPVLLQSVGEGAALTVTAAPGHPGATDEAPVLARAESPRGATVELRSADGQRRLGSVRIDGRGRSADYRIEARSGGASRTRLVFGLTGWSEPLDAKGGGR